MLVGKTKHKKKGKATNDLYKPHCTNTMSIKKEIHEEQTADTEFSIAIKIKRRDNEGEFVVWSEIPQTLHVQWTVEIDEQCSDPKPYKFNLGSQDKSPWGPQIL